MEDPRVAPILEPTKFPLSTFFYLFSFTIVESDSRWRDLKICLALNIIDLLALQVVLTETGGEAERSVKEFIHSSSDDWARPTNTCTMHTAYRGS